MNPRLKKGLGILALVVLFLVTAGLIVRNTFQIVGQNPEVGRRLGTGVRVQVARAETRRYAETIGAPCDAAPSFSQSLNKARGDLADRVSKIHVEVGDYVRPGDLLVEFDTGQLSSAMESMKSGYEAATIGVERLSAIHRAQSAERRAAMRAAEANVRSGESTLARDEANYHRMTTLFDDGLVSRFDYEDALRKRDLSEYNLRLAEQMLIECRNALANLEVTQRAEMESAVSARYGAETMLKGTQAEEANVVLRSPIEGVVTERPIQAGEWVQMGQKLVGVGQIDPVNIDARVAQEKVSHVFIGQQATVTFDAIPYEVFPAEVTKVDPSVAAGSGTFRVTLRTPNPEGAIRPGMSGFVRIKNDRTVLTIPRLGVIGIPMEGERKIQASTAVFVVEGGNARLRPVKVGDEIGDGQVEVLDGLKEGEVVIIHGLKDLQDGDPVKIR